ncbi:MAG TPA: hypothetical protein VF624_15540 [Tepidisphaeraceae bacterium]|jgi:hypothetical protein
MDDSETVSSRFWWVVLALSVVLTPAATLVAHAHGASLTQLSERGLHTLVFVAACLAMVALTACRVLIGRALESERPLPGYMLAGAGFAASFCLIAYGISSLV